MYCTGGVRCERVSMLVQSLYPEKKVYQLQGGIQTYLASLNGKKDESTGFFQGKNFVFDPRRTDPTHGPIPVIGKCLVCSMPHDDYDNGHSPSEEKEARCNTCRMLILVCNSCRCNYTCWGEAATDQRPRLYCGLDKCTHEGAAPIPELLTAASSDTTCPMDCPNSIVP
jgi:predicted sulfurtransferase